MPTPLLRILFATVSGTAQRVSEALALEGTDLLAGRVEVIDMMGASADLIDPAGPPLLLCVATRGAGDVPEEAAAFFSSLVGNPRYLGGVRYGLIALGDSSYGSTFCGGGLRFDAALEDLGARRIGEVLQLDAMEESEPERAAVAWFRDWWPTVAA